MSDPGGVQGFESVVPLGGAAPAPVEHVSPSHRGAIALTAVLLGAAVLSGVSSLLVWRDYGRVVVGRAQTGWTLPTGGMGRGWVVIVIGIAFAVAGVLVAADRDRAGRIVASVAGVSAMVFSIVEWGFGAGQSRTGPGPGMWLLFLVGLVVVAAVGMISPPADDVPADAHG